MRIQFQVWGFLGGKWDINIQQFNQEKKLPSASMAFAQSHIMAARRHQHSRLIIEVDEYSSNPTQAFTFYNINQGRFQPPHVQMVDPVPHDAPKPPGYTRFVCISDTHSRTDPIQMPYGDVLIHAGDFTELGLPSEVKKFNEWLGSYFCCSSTESNSSWVLSAVLLNFLAY
uniref:Metallophosphoesterase domain containing 1 n=1 Tax=Coturnix japonica TaxID=93934 RepID=A0A8C2YE34_COTJA